MEEIAGCFGWLITLILLLIISPVLAYFAVG